MARTTAPASLSQFFRTLAEINILPAEPIRIIRKLGKAIGLLEEDGVTLKHWQLVIDDPYVAKRLAQLLELHLNTPYKAWFASLSDAQKYQPSTWSVTMLNVPIMTEWAESRAVSRLGTMGQISLWQRHQYWDIPGMSARALNEIDAKMQLLGYKSMKEN